MRKVKHGPLSRKRLTETLHYNPLGGYHHHSVAFSIAISLLSVSAKLITYSPLLTLELFQTDYILYYKRLSFSSFIIICFIVIISFMVPHCVYFFFFFSSIIILSLIFYFNMQLLFINSLIWKNRTCSLKVYRITVVVMLRLLYLLPVFTGSKSTPMSQESLQKSAAFISFLAHFGNLPLCFDLSGSEFQVQTSEPLVC